MDRIVLQPQGPAMGQGYWPSGYSDTQSEAVRATNLAQIMIYERYNSDGTVEFQQLDDPRRGEAGGRGALRRLDPQTSSPNIRPCSI